MSVRGEVDALIPVPGSGIVLEARVHAPPDANRAIVLCHPHPLYGGSMHSPVPLAIAKCLADKAPKVAWARFNYRGVGASSGEYAGGHGEVDDARAVFEHLHRRVADAPIAICGHSFGSAVALHAAAQERAVDRVLLISPSARLFDMSSGLEGLSADVTIFIGDRDELCGVEDAHTLASALHADIRVFEGFDHHFMKSRRALAEAALSVIAPEVLLP